MDASIISFLHIESVANTSAHKLANYAVILKWRCQIVIIGKTEQGHTILVAANSPFSIQSLKEDGLVFETGNMGLIFQRAVFINEDVKATEKQLQDFLDERPKKWWHVFSLQHVWNTLTT